VPSALALRSRAVRELLPHSPDRRR
jgi:hypothetical protein